MVANKNFQAKSFRWLLNSLRLALCVFTWYAPIGAQAGAGTSPVIVFGSIIGPEVDHTNLFQIGIQELTTKCLMVRMGQILVPSILISEGYDETMGESVVQLLGAGIPPPFEILDEWQASAQIAECSRNDVHRGLWGSIIELKKHYMPIHTTSLCHKNLLIVCLLNLSFYPYYVGCTLCWVAVFDGI